MAKFRDRVGGDNAQASVELLAAIPIILVLGCSVWQAALAGITAERAAHAARVAARAVAVGGKARKAISRVLPADVAQSARISAKSNVVTVRLPVPTVIPGLSLGDVSAAARFPEQS